MQSMQEEGAARLITCAERILRGYPSLELVRRFRTLYDSHIYEKLAEKDRKTVDDASKIIQEKYGDNATCIDVSSEKRRVG